MPQKREKIKCPVCNSKFIPESFHFEKTSLDEVESKGELVEFPKGSHQLEIKPFTSIQGSFVTYCPQCGYLIKFAAEIGKKEVIEEPSLIKKWGSFKEFGQSFKYKFNPREKPYMDYSDYFIEKVDKIKKDIKNALDEVNFAQWGSSYSTWKEDKSVDSFKFLISFYSTLLDYLDSQVDDTNNKTVVQKIEELNLPKSLELLLEKVRDLRDKVAQELYELSEEEENLVERTFTQFMNYLVMIKLKPLNLDKIKIEPELSFININKIKYEIQEFLHLYLGNVLPLKEFYNDFFIPLMQELGVKHPNYNP